MALPFLNQKLDGRGWFERRCDPAAFGQIIESTPLRQMRYYIVRVWDAGSVPCSTTSIQAALQMEGRFHFRCYVARS